LLALLRFGAGWRWLSLLPLLAALAVLVILDLRTRTIPDRITLPGIGYALLISVLPAPPSVLESLLGAIVGGGGVLLVAIVTRGGMGGGDIKLMALLGAAFGWKLALPVFEQPLLIAFALSQLVGGVIALALLITRRAGRKSQLPVGALIALFGALLLSLGQ
jgi:leader peptidase (prepilin peptidase) / N-methyltransferase